MFSLVAIFIVRNDFRDGGIDFGVRFIAGTRIDGAVTIGERNVFVGQASIGTPPQDLKFRGEKTELLIGNDNTFREFVTINRGTAGGGDGATAPLGILVSNSI